MTVLQNKKDQLDLAYAQILACDKANEILELYRRGKRNSRYDNQIFDCLDRLNGEGKFYLSSKIDRYVQTDETKAEKQETDPYFILYLDELPICMIRTEINNDPAEKWDYYDYPVSGTKCFDLIKTGKVYVLNASNYGLYLIGENDYYPLSPSAFEEGNFFDQVKKLNIGFANMKIDKNELDLDLIGVLKISIKDYDYSVNKTDLSNIKRYMEDNGEETDDCSLIGPVPLYQYGFTSIDQIEVCDNNRENGSMMFKLVRSGKVIGYMHYDPYDDGCESQIESEANEADKTEKDINKYYVSLSPLGYIFKDCIVVENKEDPDYSPIDRMVAEKIQEKIKEGSMFNVYQLI